MIRLLAFAFLALAPFTAFAADAFVKIKLPKGVTVELPRNWGVLSKSQRTTLSAASQSISEKAGVYDSSGDLAFASNLVGDDGKTAAMFNIRYYPEIDLSQQDAKEATPQDIRDLDTMLRTEAEKGGAAFGGKILEWRGTKRQEINGITAFVSEYTRAGVGGNKDFCVRLVRIFRNEQSYTATVSYRIAEEPLLRPICDRVIESLRGP